MKHLENFEHGCYYYVFNKGNNNENLFVEYRNYDYFLQLMQKYLLKVADIYAYCLLEKDFHLIVRIKDKNDIVNPKMRTKVYLGFAHCFNAYAQGFNKVYARKGSLFTEHLKRKKISEDGEICKIISFVHNKSLKQDVGISISSYESILIDDDRIVDTAEVIQFFGNKEIFIKWHKEKMW